jgi:hypothetical protein
MWILDFSSDFDDFIYLATLLQMLLANGPSNSTKGVNGLEGGRVGRRSLILSPIVLPL